MKKQRNRAILANYRREISLATKFVKDKTKYNRKEKHVKRIMEE